MGVGDYQHHPSPHFLLAGAPGRAEQRRRGNSPVPGHRPASSQGQVRCSLSKPPCTCRCLVSLLRPLAWPLSVPAVAPPSQAAVRPTVSFRWSGPTPSGKHFRSGGLRVRPTKASLAHSVCGKHQAGRAMSDHSLAWGPEAAPPAPPLRWASRLLAVTLTVGLWVKTPSEPKTTLGCYSAVKGKLSAHPTRGKPQSSCAELKKPDQKECVLSDCTQKALENAKYSTVTENRGRSEARISVQRVRFGCCHFDTREAQVAVCRTPAPAEGHYLGPPRNPTTPVLRWASVVLTCDADVKNKSFLPRNKGKGGREGNRGLPGMGWGQGGAGGGVTKGYRELWG